MIVGLSLDGFSPALRLWDIAVLTCLLTCLYLPWKKTIYYPRALKKFLPPSPGTLAVLSLPEHYSKNKNYSSKNPWIYQKGNPYACQGFQTCLLTCITLPQSWYKLPRAQDKADLTLDAHSFWPQLQPVASRPGLLQHSQEVSSLTLWSSLLLSWHNHQHSCSIYFFRFAI